MKPISDIKVPARGYSTEESRHAAVAARDAGADGEFVYSVRTTGVYCRPSCPARRPRRENVAFHDSPGAARHAGFRPCKRCRPDEPTKRDPHAAKIAAACRTIDGSDELPSLDELAVAAGMSRYHFHRVFVRTVGMTPQAYGQARRAERVRAELGRGASVTEAIYEAGYQSSGPFYSGANRMLGMAPKRYRQGGMGETIRFAVGECSLGSVLAASTAQGVCAILLGDDPNELAIELQNRFVRATLVGGDQEYERVVAGVVGLVDAPGSGHSLPLDIRGTAFQRRVWQALREIPVGGTASYAEIAGRIGLPGGARAVAGACAANPLAVAIPCHRVVRSDGSLSGYRWGVERKRQLLERETG
ncbi:bifunctional DNA-binding transcriptional regulator/O6-methylguanine-DNA methyltransferase Ada [soil metagenome]